MVMQEREECAEHLSSKGMAAMCCVKHASLHLEADLCATANRALRDEERAHK